MPVRFHAIVQDADDFDEAWPAGVGPALARRSRAPLTDERGEGRIDGLKPALWACRASLPEMPRIKGHYCFDPEQIDRLEVEGEIISDESC